MCPQCIGQIHPVVRNHADDFGNALADSFCNRKVDAVVDIAAQHAGVQSCFVAISRPYDSYRIFFRPHFTVVGQSAVQIVIHRIKRPVRAIVSVVAGGIRCEKLFHIPVRHSCKPVVLRSNDSLQRKFVLVRVEPDAQAAAIR